MNLSLVFLGTVSIIITQITTAQLIAPLDLDFDLNNPAYLADSHPKISRPVTADMIRASDDMSTSTTSSTTISDHIASLRHLSIFASLARDVSSIQSLLEDPNETLVLLCPTNNVLRSLDQKPWATTPSRDNGQEMQDQPKGQVQISAEGKRIDSYSGSEGAARAGRQLEEFLRRHVLRCEAWSEGRKCMTLNGGQVWWEMDDEEGKVDVVGGENGAQRPGSKRRIMPGGVKGLVEKRTGNGEIWSLEGAL